jgi:type I restriction enzyme S subunit
MSRAALTPLGSIAEVIRGVTFSKSDVKSSSANGLAPILRAGNIQDELILNEDLVFVAKEKISAKQELRAGDIIMCTSSGSADVVGKTAFLQEDWGGSFGAFCATIRARIGECVPRYLFHYLRTPEFRSWTSNSSGINIKNIRKSELDSVLVPLPSFNDQCRIAKLLDKAEGVLKKRRQVLTLGEDFLTSAYLDLFGDPLSNPKGWPVRPLGEYIAEIRYGTSTKCGDKERESDVAVLRIPNVVAGAISWEDLKFTQLPKQEIDRLLMRNGDILFVRTNGNPDYIGRCAVFDSEQQAVFASYLIRGRLHSNSAVTPLHVSTTISMPSYRHRVVQEAKTTAGNYNVNIQGLSSLPIIEPPQTLQATYAKLVKKTAVINQKGKDVLREADDLFRTLSKSAFISEL